MCFVPIMLERQCSSPEVVADEEEINLRLLRLVYQVYVERKCWYHPCHADLRIVMQHRDGCHIVDTIYY